MEDLYNTPQLTGTFMVEPDKEVYGTLVLDGWKTLLHVSSDKTFRIAPPVGETITGTLSDLRKVSLINYATSEAPSSAWRQDAISYFYEIFVPYVVLGDCHVLGSERNISSMSFAVDDAEILFQGTDAFGVQFCQRGLLEKILYSDDISREVSIGENPLIAYYTGSGEIFSSDTVIGKITAHHGPSWDFGGSHGALIKNKIFINIDFGELITIDETFSRMHQTLRFLGLIVGRAQNPTKISVRVGTDEPPCEADVYASMYPEHKRHEEDSPTVHGVLIDATQDSDEFSRVLTTWLKRDKNWSYARWGFSNGWESDNTSIEDRLVKTANIFDLIPEIEFPDHENLPEDLLSAVADAQDRFHELSRHPARDSVLSALGRVGKLTLRPRINHRAQVLLDVIEERLPDLSTVISEAVKCRNFFVHGSEANIEYEKNMGTVLFLTKTLEFIFAASDLVDAGWNIRNWSKRARDVMHPFGYYLSYYEHNLHILKSLLSRQS